jgi:glycosyltransferase involved in cell wall biosynthesis
MRFLLMHQTVVEHDAIGRDIVEMYRILSGLHECFLFCEYSSGLHSVAVVDLARATALVKDPQCVVLYHHSIYWPAGEQILSAASGPLVFKYHNITPPNYFARTAYWNACVAGREQTYRYVQRFPRALWLSDSLFNLQELGIDEGVCCRVVPPFPGASDSNGTAPDEELLRALLADRRLHVLSVGRLAPNKGHLFLLRVIDYYRTRYKGGVVLHIVGKRDGALQEYFESILALSRELALGDAINIAGETSASQILSYFLGSDVYLCCSEHEGFCVPIVESQSLCLPVIARARSAVPETIGAGQILLGENPAPYADGLHQLKTQAGLRERVIERGRQNYLERFTAERIGERFLAALKDFGLPV